MKTNHLSLIIIALMNLLYFNAPIRWAIVRRIYKLAGINYSFSQFLVDDRIPEVPRSAQIGVEPFIPSAPPVIKQLRTVNGKWEITD